MYVLDGYWWGKDISGSRNFRVSLIGVGIGFGLDGWKDGFIKFYG